MVSDDITALAGISMGALASAAVTLSLMASAPEDPARVNPPRVSVVVEPARSAVCRTERPIVDFAIIRSDPEVMVGPEGHHSGWEPQSLEMRLLRSR